MKVLIKSFKAGKAPWFNGKGMKEDGSEIALNSYNLDLSSSVGQWVELDGTLEMNPFGKPQLKLTQKSLGGGELRPPSPQAPSGSSAGSSKPSAPNPGRYTAEEMFMLFDTIKQHICFNGNMSQVEAQLIGEVFRTAMVNGVKINLTE